MPPMWSSCAWVITMASTRPNRSSRLEKSGRIRSTPGWSCSGNSTPQSTTSRRPRYSNTVMFRPISPRPPRPTRRRPLRGSGGGGPRSGCGWLTRRPRSPSGGGTRSCRTSRQLHTARHQIGAKLLDLSLRRVDQWETGDPAGQAKQAQRGLRHDGALGAGHDPDDDRQQVEMDLAGLLDAPGPVRVDHVVQPVADHVADHADEPGRTEEGILVHEFDLDFLDRHRAAWGFFRD